MDNDIRGLDPMSMAVEWVDALEGAGHEFGAAYRSRNAALLARLAREQRRGGTRRRLPRAVAAALVAACVALPVGAYAAATHADFLDGAFGTGWRESRPAEQGLQRHDGEKAATPVAYPASEVAQLDPEEAEALLGDAVCDEPVSFAAPDGHELTVTSAVRSEDAMAYRFTLHRDGGVTCLHWDEHTNNVASKGAHAPLDAQMSWSAAGDEFVYVDPGASTADTIVGYAYAVFGEPIPQGSPVPLTVYTCDVPFDEDFEEGQFHEQTIDIPCTEAVASASFSSGTGGAVSISPLGLVLDVAPLFAESSDPDGYDMAADPVNVRAITVKMADGSAYTVIDQTADLDNTLSLCGFGSDLSLAFNRLVDPGKVESVEVVVTDAEDMDGVLGEGGDWPSDADRPTRTVVYDRS